MIDEAGEVATFGCVYNGIVIHTEHVATADALILIALLSHICNNLQMGTRQLQTDHTKSNNADSLVDFTLTCRIFWPTYSITISSAAIGSMANNPQS